MIVFEAKMDPGGLQKRVGETVGNLSGQKCLQEAPGASKKTQKAFWGGFDVKVPVEARTLEDPQGGLARASSIEEKKETLGN